MNVFRLGMFWEIGDYIKDYLNLSKMNKFINKNVMIDGKFYGIYRECLFFRQGIVIWKDWLDNLNLKMLKMLDEFYEVVKVFMEDDLDKDGKDDIFGLIDCNDLIYGVFKMFGFYEGMLIDWKELGGKFMFDFMMQEYKDIMNYMKKLCDNGYMNKDFFVISKIQQ